MLRVNILISRLIDCGMSRDCAIRVCQHYRKHKTMSELEDYVASVEAEIYGSVDNV